MIYPWQKNEWQQLMHLKKMQRLPHAFMFVGIGGIGKVHLADQFAQSILCQHAKKSGEGCDECHACRMMLGRVHPNILWIAPEKEGGAIKIDQIRGINEFASQTAMQGAHKFILISSAHKMNVNAANALLKTLEEPSDGTIIILMCDQMANLPATIASRCHRILCHVPDQSVAEQWLTERLPSAAVSARLLLKLVDGAPLAATQFIESDYFSVRKELLEGMIALAAGTAEPLHLAHALHQNNPLLLINTMLSFIGDLLKAKYADLVGMTHLDYELQIKQLSQINSAILLELMTELQRLRVAWLNGIHLNKQLMLESIFIKWSQQNKVTA